ncbi:MAG: four helix bundle protein [Sedimentisphaerales bacterium]|jgi:four helix bundle protein
MQNQSVKPKASLKDRAYAHSIRVIGFIDTLPKDNATQVIANQLLRSATSIGANIVEAKGSSSKRDFANFFSYSLKSANETIYWLGLLKDTRKVDGPEMRFLIDETEQIAKMLGASLLTLKGKREI